MRPTSVGKVTIGGDAAVRLMGVINCSPESFFSGSYVPPEKIRTRASEMSIQGADIIDIGARSTAPNAPPLSVAEEKARIIIALQHLEECENAISVDTMHPEVLKASIRFEIDAVNDIGGLANSSLAAMAADAGLAVIAMATFNRPGDPVGVEQTMEALKLVLSRAERHDIEEIVLDPAVGRWTDAWIPDRDWDICTNFSRFLIFDKPLLAAISRKSFIGDLLSRTPEERLAGSLAVTFSLLEQGASIVRTHDIGETRDVIQVFERLRRGA
jgi:dihydropteroate synthase